MAVNTTLILQEDLSLKSEEGDFNFKRNNFGYFPVFTIFISLSSPKYE